MRQRIVAVSVLIGITWGCGDESGDQPPPIDLTVATTDLQLGQVEGDGPEVFGRIGAMLGDSLDRIFVADYQAGEVRVFDSTGVHLFSFGRKGAGPGEQVSPCCMTWGPDGLLWIRDGGNHRYSAFSVGRREATFRSTVEMVHSDVNFLVPTTFSPSGELIDIGHRPGPSGNLEIVRFAVTLEGQLLSETPIAVPDPVDIGQFTVEGTTETGPFARYFYQPFGPSQLVAHGPLGGWAHGLSSEYAITLMHGRDSVTVAGQAVAPPLSEAERRRGLEQIEADAQRAGVRPGRLPYDLPDSKPPLRAIFFDTEGRLWVEHSVLDGSPRTADIWDQSGALVKRVQWPNDVSLTLPGWVDGDWGLGLRRDSLGVDYVVRLRF